MKVPFKFKHALLWLIKQKPVSATSCFQTECQSWALCVSLFLPGVSYPPSCSLLCLLCFSLIYLVHFNLYTWSISPGFCPSALYSFSMFLCHLCLLLSSLCQLHFSSHYSFLLFCYPFSRKRLSFYFELLQPTIIISSSFLQSPS